VTVGEWLAARTPRPPRVLGARIGLAMGESLSLDLAHAPEALLAAGERVIAELLRGGSTTRESALDLLTADALVTYAFEAAAESPADLVPRASDAMMRIAALGAGSGASARATA
jgi:hypothetical protein